MNVKPTIANPDDKPQGVSVSVGDGAITLSYEEAAKLATLSEHPGYATFRSLLKGMLESTTVALRQRAANIEDVRYQQGIAGAVTRIAEVLDKDLPEWYKEGSREGSGDDNA